MQMRRIEPIDLPEDYERIRAQLVRLD